MDDRTERFLTAALERDWITPDQVEEARRIRDTVAEVGVEQSVEEILVKKGYLAPDQARQLNRELSVTKVGKYEILEKLGEGGAGIVYKANQETLERKVAIKVLSKRRVGSEKYVERFLREARVAVTLNHRNIVRGLDYGEADGYHYFVMEFVEGDSVYTVLKREGVLEEKKALEITLQVVDALRHASTYDLVHRDIKPENILLTEGGVAKLCDLGLAKPSLVETAQISRDGTTIGTPTYMSPEQIRGKDDADFRSDVYSLGATLYHMVTGRPPFTGESADILVRKHLREPPTDPREHNLKLSSAAASVLMKMLAKRPEDRYGSLDSLAEDLKAVQEGRPPTHTIQFGGRKTPAKVRIDREEGAPRRSRLAESERKSRGPLIALVVVLLAAGAAAAFLLGRGGAGGDGDGSGTAVEAPDEADTPTASELAENLFLEAKDFEDRNPDASDEAVMDRYRLVLEKYPQTRHGLLAKDRIRAIESRREAADRQHREKAKELYEARLSAASALVKAGRFGDAIAELAKYPEGYEDTSWPAKLAEEAERVADQAETEKEEVFQRADEFSRAGRYEKAVAALERLAGVGIPGIEAAVREKLAEVRKAEQAERAAREKGLRVFRAEVGTAFLRAAAGEWSAAESDLVKAGEREELVYHGEALNQAFEDLRSARRFEEAMQKGAQRMEGESERFGLIRGTRPTVVGRVLGANETGIRLARTGGEELVPFHGLAPAERVRLAFEVLDGNRAEDHEAAALYLLIHGHLEESAAETKAASVLGASSARLEAVTALFRQYLRERADVEILRASGYRSRGQLEEARHLLEGVVDRTPWYPTARYEYGVVLLESGKLEEAVAELTRADELGFDEPRLQYWLGEAFYRLDDPVRALDAYTRFANRIQDDPRELERVRERINDLQAKALSARVEELSEQARDAVRKNQFDEAVELYTKLNDLSPNAEDSLYHLARVWLEKEEYLQAYRNLRRYLDAAPSGRRAVDAKKQMRILEKAYRENQETVKYLTEGIEEHQRGNYQLALSLFDRSIEAGPLNEEAYYSRYLSHLRLGEKTGDSEEFEAALADLGSTAFLDPDEDLVHEGRAIVLYYLGRMDEALESATRAIAALPDRWQAYNIAGLVHHTRGDDEESVTVLTKGIEKSPGEATLYINRALAREGQKDYEKARADLKAASERNPGAWQIEEIGKILDRLLKAEEED